MPEPLPPELLKTFGNAFTVDVEDYFQVEALAGAVRREAWHEYPARVEANTLRILDLLDRHGVRATFFILGWVARRFPRLVAEIALRGHEIGSHSFWHRLVYTLSPEEFRSDLREARSAIEDAAQVRVRGFRAPSFSITRKALWAFTVLSEEGYTYDASVFPVRHDIYGFPEFPRFPVRVLSGGNIIEFPQSTVGFLGCNLPGPGGGYLRILPLAYSLWALRRIHAMDRAPAVVYVHPWEIDPDQPRICVALRSRLRHYTGLSRMERKIEGLLRRFRFQPLGDVLSEHPPRESWPDRSGEGGPLSARRGAGT